MPSNIHSTFQDLIRVPVNYKCVIDWENINFDLDYFKKVFQDKVDKEILGPDYLEQIKPNAIFDVKSSTIAIPKCNADFTLVAKNVAHFYVGLPAF